jgi:hypothetical protein
MRRIEPDRGAILPPQVRQTAGRAGEKRRAEDFRGELGPRLILRRVNFLDLGTRMFLQGLRLPVQLKLAREPFFIGATLLFDVLALGGLSGGAALFLLAL